MTGQICDILIEPPLCIRYLAGRSDTLVVCLSGVGSHRHQEPPIELFNSASDGGVNHVVFISDSSRCWLNSEDMAEKIVAAIERKAREVGARRVVALGNSMGGTMALHLSRLMRFDAVLAIVPQYSVDPKVVPEETRWEFFRQQIKEFRFPRVEGLQPEQTKYFIIHGGHDKELVHALKFSKIRGVGHFIMPGMGHNLAAALKKSGNLEPLIKSALAGYKWQFRRGISSLGGQFRSVFESASQESP